MARTASFAAVLTAASTLFIGQAAATVVDFAQRHVSTFASQALTEDGVTLTLTPGTFDVDSYSGWRRTGTATINQGGAQGDAQLERSRYGLALTNGRHDSSHMIDGKGQNDVALFSFSEQVSLDNVVFNFVDWNDDFTLFVGDTMDSLSAFSVSNIFAAAAKGTTLVELGVVGRVFGIGAKGKNDDFKIRGLKFTRLGVTNDVDPPVVTPLPGAVPLMATAMAGFGFARRRKAKKAA